MKPILLFLIFFILCISCLTVFSEDTSQEDVKDTKNVPGEPVPYSDEEFSQWVKDLRRAEIIMFGSLPFTLLLSFFTYDIIRFGVHNWEQEYNPFGNPNQAPYTVKEGVFVVLTACTISLVIAIIDYMLGRREKIKLKKETNLRKKVLEEL